MLGLEGLGREELGRRLRGMDAVEMCQKLPLAQHFCALVDGEWLKADVKLSVLADGGVKVHKRRWCREMVVGDTADDVCFADFLASHRFPVNLDSGASISILTQVQGTIVKARILGTGNPLQRLHTLCSQHLTPEETSALFSAYDLPIPNSSSPADESQKHFQNLLNLASDLRFHLPSLHVQRGWLSSPHHKDTSSSITRYHFHIPNSFPGAHMGLASHELDVAYLLQNFRELMGEKDRALADQVSDAMIGFVNGEGWAEAKVGEVVVFSGEGVEKLRADEYDRRWRKGRGKVLLSIDADKLWRVAEGWQGVRPDKNETTERARL
jgi:hypothetical protein